jgi:hypothetical protein
MGIDLETNNETTSVTRQRPRDKEIIPEPLLSNALANKTRSQEKN